MVGGGGVGGWVGGGGGGVVFWTNYTTYVKIIGEMMYFIPERLYILSINYNTIHLLIYLFKSIYLSELQIFIFNNVISHRISCGELFH